MKNKLFILLLVILSCIPLLDWLHPGFPITHDGQDHIARIANFYQNLSEGNIIPRWAENLNWGYGHPILMFLYPLPSYIASLFHFLGLSFVDSTKAVFIVAFILSGLTMYLWCREFVSEEAAFIGGLAYMFARYRFVDLYVRGDIGEHLAFTFVPLVFYSLLKVYKQLPKAKQNTLAQYLPQKQALFGGIALALLILAHNAISLMFVPLIFLYAIYLFCQTKQRLSFAINVGYIFLFGFLLSAFFWIPALFEGKYTLRDIVTKGSIEQNFYPLIKYFYSPWSYGGSGELSVQIGPLKWLSIISLIPITIYFYRKKKKVWMLAGGSFLIFIMVLFLMNQSSLFIWEKISLLQKFQFPWRLLAIVVFITSLAATILISWLPKKYSSAAIVLFILLIIISNGQTWHAKGYQYKPESFYSGIYHGTTDTGESAPIWSVRFMEHIPKAHLETISGKAKITENKRTSVDHQYSVNAQTKIQLRENTLYFPGWVVKVDGQPVAIQYQDPNNRGLMTFFVASGTHNIDVHFGETKLRLISDYTSLIALIIVIILATTPLLTSKKQQKGR